LLLHDFVNRDSVDLGHLVKLVDTNDTSIRQDHGSGFQPSLSRVLVSGDSSRQTDAGRSSTGGGNSERSRVEDESEHLRLSSRWVTDHQNVDISTNVSAVFQIFLLSSKKQQQDGLLDVVAAVDRRGERLRKKVEDVSSFRQFVDVSNVRVGQRGLGDTSPLFRRQEDDVVSDDLGAVLELGTMFETYMKPRDD
jgi:hypothetical protein